jgi:hypothetical protein
MHSLGPTPKATVVNAGLIVWPEIVMEVDAVAVGYVKNHHHVVIVMRNWFATGNSHSLLKSSLNIVQAARKTFPERIAQVN